MCYAGALTFPVEGDLVLHDGAVMVVSRVTYYGDLLLSDGVQKGAACVAHPYECELVLRHG